MNNERSIFSATEWLGLILGGVSLIVSLIFLEAGELNYAAYSIAPGAVIVVICFATAAFRRKSF